jgi:hypothetical protein
MNWKLPIITDRPEGAIGVIIPEPLLKKIVSFIKEPTFFFNGYHLVKIDEAKELISNLIGKTENKEPSK